MQPVRFIHAADLHLDTVFSGLSKKIDKNIAKELHESTFIALEKLVELALNQKVDFIILAGDIYNQEDCSLRAQIAVRDACEKLNAAAIQVFIVSGNHDPYSSRLKHLKWTDNVHIFPAEQVKSFSVYRKEELIAKIYGISHSSTNETRNLAKQYQAGNEECLHLGILHTSVNMESEKYAACSLEDLKNSHMHYFALGHIHNYEVLSQEPLIAYSGATQGLHIDECGAKGCLLVTAIPETDLFLSDHNKTNNFSFEVKFENLGPLLWQRIEVNLEDFEDITTLDRHLEQVMSDFASLQENKYENIILRFVLNGRTKLDEDLHKAKILEDLTNFVREYGECLKPKIWLQDIKIQTKNYFDETNALQREDLLGEILKLANIWEQEEKSFKPRITDILEPLFSNPRIKKVINGRTESEYKQLLSDAKRLCIDILEKE